MRTKNLALIAVAVVHWTLIFRQTYDDKPTETKREMRFETEKEARAFYNHRPTGLFQCVNSLTAMPGFCEVKDVTLTQKGDSNDYRHGQVGRVGHKTP